MFTALLILQVVLGLSIIGLVLLQQGKGADMGAAFGAGASGTVFGARGSGSFFTRATAVLATAFFLNSVFLSSPLVLGERHPSGSIAGSVATENMPAAPVEKAPPAGEDTVDLPPADLPAVDNGAAADSAADAPAAAGAPEAATPAPAGKAAASKPAADSAAAGAADKKQPE